MVTDLAPPPTPTPSATSITAPTPTPVRTATPTATTTALPPPTASPTPTATAAANAVLVGAADIARCDANKDEATAALINGIPGTVFAAGDLAYSGSAATDITDCYGPSWGQFKNRTDPAIGNHEYEIPGATSYWNYWGSAAGTPGQGWYAFNLGTWRIYVLNANCDKVACNSGSPQETWLRADLAANPRQCVAAIWHQPLYSSSYGTINAVRPFWQALYDYHAEIIINGHSHNYERFAQMDPTGAPAPGRGLKEFVVGTGGASPYAFTYTPANSELRNSGAFGVIKFTLKQGSYDWQFIPVAGQTFTDSGSGTCV